MVCHLPHHGAWYLNAILMCMLPAPSWCLKRLWRNPVDCCVQRHLCRVHSRQPPRKARSCSKGVPEVALQCGRAAGQRSRQRGQQWGGEPLIRGPLYHARHLIHPWRQERLVAGTYVMLCSGEYMCVLYLGRLFMGSGWHMPRSPPAVVGRAQALPEATSQPMRWPLLLRLNCCAQEWVGTVLGPWDLQALRDPAEEAGEPGQE